MSNRPWSSPAATSNLWTPSARLARIAVGPPGSDQGPPSSRQRNTRSPAAVKSSVPAKVKVTSPSVTGLSDLSAGPATIAVSGGWLSTQPVGGPQTPLAGSQTPAAPHQGGFEQLTPAPPVHTPPWQASPPVQASPSLQVVPSGCAGFEQVPVIGSQTPT